MAKLEGASVTLRKFSSQDRQFIRRWTIGVFAFYGMLAVTVVTLSFVLHAPNDTTAARGTANTQQATLVR
jgi:hypothetical protein